ncbi:DUF2325 domain-containing protein [Inquilinus limosus]|uniref:DUF2325 domain-containing protein n=1 Tax=Inquilinus limosus TaxID=171674 RepID=A0A211Z2L3_9PROT|nr:DUF2325 domain-containing protein [Inquilinus limosus]OWJ59434.1 hypothetical protein BWR60_32450 [Inquilinus limosus]
MPTLSVFANPLQRAPASSPLVIPHPPAAVEPDGLRLPAKGRDRIWELSPNLHCSVVGTCLSTGDLRQLFAKLNEPDARTASDHVLHGRAVRAAGQKEVAGKLLNKLLDKRHETAIRRFAKARTAAEVRALWQEALERGDIPGAYWAVLSHPATDGPLVQEVYGEVHMLSHLVGMSNRADIARLRHLEQELGARDERIARQEERLLLLGAERDALGRRVAELEQADRRRAIAPALAAPADEALRRRLADEQARSALLAGRLAAQDEAIATLTGRAEQAEDQAAALHDEIAALEAALDAPAAEAGDMPGPTPALRGRTLLYVGGRPKQVDQLRALTARFGGMLLSHDGGVEDSPTLLPGLVSQADAAFFPVDCVSHHAAGQVKRLCREAEKPFVPLRTSSLASFAAAVGTMGRAAAE